MPSNKFLKIARGIAAKNPEMFDSLMEFERTKKIRTKTRLNFTVEKSIASGFRRYCREKGYNMSSKIEKAMEEIMGKK